MAAQGADPHGTFCAVRVAQSSSQVAMPRPTCFDTEPSRSSFLRQEGVNVSTRSLTANSSVILGTLYKDINMGGDSLVMYGTGGCYAATYGFSSLTSDWATSVSSALADTSNGCWVTLYSATDYDGNRFNCTPYCATIPGMNDDVKSVVFRPVGTFG